MAIIGASYPSIVDMFKGSTEGEVVNMLRMSNPILFDAIATATNMDTVHRHSILTGLPSATWGRLYQGVQPSKATMQQVDDTTGWLEARSEIDTRLLDIANNVAKTRFADTQNHVETLNQTMASHLFYGSRKANPERFDGLGTRYGTLGTSGIGKQIINGGGVGSDNTSIYFVTWGDHAASLLYPKNTRAGIKIMDRGTEPVRDSNGGTYYAKVATYEWHVGMFVKDWRYCVRVANIDVSNMKAGTVDVWALLMEGYYRWQGRKEGFGMGRPAIYMNTDTLMTLDKQSTDRALLTANANTVPLTPMTLEGRVVKTYRGIPIRETDAILSTEARVV